MEFICVRVNGGQEWILAVLMARPPILAMTGVRVGRRRALARPAMGGGNISEQQRLISEALELDSLGQQKARRRAPPCAFTNAVPRHIGSLCKIPRRPATAAVLTAPAGDDQRCGRECHGLL